MTQANDLSKRRAFYIHQLIRLTGDSLEELEKLNTNELQQRERDFYYQKHNMTVQSEYRPSTL